MCGDVFCLREDLRGRLTVETGGARAARVVLDLDFLMSWTTWPNNLPQRWGWMRATHHSLAPCEALNPCTQHWQDRAEMPTAKGNLGSVGGVICLTRLCVTLYFSQKSAHAEDEAESLGQ